MTALDLDAIEARRDDNGHGWCQGCGTDPRGSGWRVESKGCEVRALVAEVRRLRQAATCRPECVCDPAVVTSCRCGYRMETKEAER